MNTDCEVVNPLKWPKYTVDGAQNIVFNTNVPDLAYLQPDTFRAEALEYLSNTVLRNTGIMGGLTHYLLDYLLNIYMNLTRQILSNLTIFFHLIVTITLLCSIGLVFKNQ